MQDESKDIEWRCQNIYFNAKCDALLGVIDSATRTVVQIKIRKAEYSIVNADQVQATCRKCGAFQRIVNTKPRS